MDSNALRLKFDRRVTAAVRTSPPSFGKAGNAQNLRQFGNHAGNPGGVVSGHETRPCIDRLGAGLSRDRSRRQRLDAGQPAGDLYPLWLRGGPPGDRYRHHRGCARSPPTSPPHQRRACLRSADFGGDAGPRVRLVCRSSDAAAFPRSRLRRPAISARHDSASRSRGASNADWQEPLELHVDSYFHAFWFTVNF